MTVAASAKLIITQRRRESRSLFESNGTEESFSARVGIVNRFTQAAGGALATACAAATTLPTLPRSRAICFQWALERQHLKYLCRSTLRNFRARHQSRGCL